MRLYNKGFQNGWSAEKLVQHVVLVWHLAAGFSPPGNIDGSESNVRT